jgi:hypothetical protein
MRLKGSNLPPKASYYWKFTLPVNDEISISPENAAAFKDWMGH